MKDTWLPENFSQSGQIIDNLFNMIHVVCAVIFLLTTTVLGYALWRFRGRAGDKANYVHSNTLLEVIWSIIPAGILIFLSLYQYDSWAEDKMRRPIVETTGQPMPPQVKVIAKQFGWEFYYPGEDGTFGTVDDVYLENELYVPSDEAVVLQLESRDVIHSFFIPALRVKQDIVPGMKHFIWFEANGSDPNDSYSIACTELCGWGHYKMKAWIRILPRKEFDAKMAQLNRERMSTTLSADDLGLGGEKEGGDNE